MCVYHIHTYSIQFSFLVGIKVWTLNNLPKSLSLYVNFLSFFFGWINVKRKEKKIKWKIDINIFNDFSLLIVPEFQLGSFKEHICLVTQMKTFWKFLKQENPVAFGILSKLFIQSLDSCGLCKLEWKRPQISVTVADSDQISKFGKINHAEFTFSSWNSEKKFMQMKIYENCMS